MEIIFNVNNLQRIQEISFYNHNYYHLPYSINGCNVLYEEWIDDDSSGTYNLGNLVNGVFVKQLSFYGDTEGRVDLINNVI